jgi:nucleotide-binding universal stress UspA family protein
MKIVCAIDGSRHSHWTIDWLPKLCDPTDSSVLFVHAVDMTQFKPLPKLDRKARSALVKMLEWSLEGAARLLERAEVKAAQSGMTVRAKLLRGRPAEAIAGATRRERADLLIVGARGTTEFQPILLGSVSRKLLMQAPCPVLVVKKPARTISRVVVGADGSIESWEAVARLKALPLDIRPTVTVASVIPPLPLDSLRVPARAVAAGDQVESALRREARKLAGRVAGVLRQAGFSAEGIVLSGPPGAELVKLADSERADFIVVGSRSGRSLHEYFMGSVSDMVVKHAPCSVLVCRR